MFVMTVLRSRVAALRQTLAQNTLPGMEIDLGALSTCLRTRFPQHFALGAPPPQVQQLGQDFTYELRFDHDGDVACDRLVLRLHERAGHEYRLLSGLHALARRPDSDASCLPVVPTPLMLMEDRAVMGKPFLVSELVTGRKFFDAAFTDAVDSVHVGGAQNPRMGSLSKKAVQAEAADRTALQYALVDAAAALHSVDVEAVSSVMPESASAHQTDGSLQGLTRMATRVYEASNRTALQAAPRLTSAMEHLAEWLPRAQPAGEASELTRLTHGDLHVEHVVFHPDEPRVAAITGGWTYWSLGHPGADLAMLALPYVTPGTLQTKHQGFGTPSTRAAMGLPGLDAFLERYVARSGLASVRAHFDYYLAHACFRVAAATAARPEPTEDELRFASQMAGAGLGCAQRCEQQGA